MNLEVSFVDQLLRMHSLAMAHCPRAFTFWFEIPSYCLRQAKAHSRPSSWQSDKQRVVLRQVQSCAQVFSSYPQLLIKQRRTCLLSSFTCLRASTRAHQPSEQGSMYRQSFFFQCFPPWCHLVASPGRTRSMMHAKAQSTMERMLEEVFRCILCRKIFVENLFVACVVECRTTRAWCATSHASNVHMSRLGG